MTSSKSSRMSASASAGPTTASEHQGWILAAGIAELILGIMALSATIATSVVSTFFLGILFLVGAVAQIVQAFKGGGGAGLVVLRLLLALLFLLVGVGLIMRPLLGAATLTLAIALLLIPGGAALILVGVVARWEHWQLTTVLGVLGIILGILLLVHWPVSGLYAIGAFVAIFLIGTGISWIASALMAMTHRPELRLAQPAG